MKTLPFIDWHEWQRLPQHVKERYAADIREKFDLELDLVQGIYVDSGVVGVVRYLTDDNGRKYAIGNSAAVELVGRSS